MSAIAYDDAPRPLTDKERELVQRVFSDWFEVPGEWKTALRADLERDPPILGKTALGGQTVTPKSHSVINDSVADGAGIALEKLASAGQIGNSSAVEILTAAIRLGGDVSIARTATNRLDVNVDTLRLGATNDLQLRRAAGRLEVVGDLRIGATNDLDLKRGAAGRLDVVGDGLRLGAAGDIDLVRSAADQLDLPDALRINLNKASVTQTPLYLNVNGTLYQVLVGGAGTGPGGVGRALYVNF